MDLALRKYRAFLDRDLDNAPVRAEVARLLAAHSGGSAQEAEEAQLGASLEMLAAIRAFLRTNRLSQAARCAGEAQALGLPLALTPRERLRLAGAAEEAGDTKVAIALLYALTSEAAKWLMGLLEKYPQSELARRARELQTNV